MKKPIIIGVYGKSNSGKTMLISKIIRDLIKENNKISTVKITDKNVSIDTIGKDTWRHHEAGSNLVVLQSPKETDIIIKKQLSENQIYDFIKVLGIYDIIIVEGSRDESIPKIKVGDIIEIRKNTILSFNNNYDEIIHRIKNMINTRGV